MSPTHRPRKRFGQHFLVRRDIGERIIELAALSPQQAVLEIGPGQGALTDALAARASKLILIEIDRDLTARLRERHAGDPHVRIVGGDVLKLDLAAELADDAPVSVVANLPYNISTPLIARLVERPQLYRRLVLMLQSEVAERICAAPGGKDYGSLSVLVQLAANARIALRVPPSAFKPPPKVESAVIVIEPFATARLSDDERDAVQKVTRSLFTQRRKQLGNQLRRWTTEPNRVLEELEIDPKRRAETLSPDDFVRLTRALSTGGEVSPMDDA